LKHSFGFEVGYIIDITWRRGQGGVVPPSLFLLPKNSFILGTELKRDKQKELD